MAAARVGAMDIDARLGLPGLHVGMLADVACIVRNAGS